MRVWSYVSAIAAIGIAIAVLELVGRSVNGATAAQLLLLVLLFDARFYGRGPVLAASVFGAAGFIRYFVKGGFSIGDPNDWAALVAFVIMAVVGGELAARAERRAAEAQRQRAEIEELYRQLQGAFDRASEAEAARRNEELKATLLDALTHNLRTPLTAIKAAVTALLPVTRSGGTNLTGENRDELLHVIDEESDRLNRFIEGLSTVRHTAGHPHFRPVRLEAIVDAGLGRAEALTRDHRVIISIEPGVPPAAVEVSSVAEVIYMLLDNASKYAPAGTTIDIRAQRGDEHHVTVSVADQGPGIPVEYRERVFENFFQIASRPSRDPRRVGVGLGLPIARRLIEAQGGRMWIDTPPSGQGTMIVISLPAAQPEGADEPLAVAV